MTDQPPPATPNVNVPPPPPRSCREVGRYRKGQTLDETLAQALDSLEIGNPVSHDPLHIFPLQASHSAAGDFARWGRLGGLQTLRCYGRPWFALLGQRRWGRVGAGALDHYRAQLAAKTWAA